MNIAIVDRPSKGLPYTLCYCYFWIV